LGPEDLRKLQEEYEIDYYLNWYQHYLEEKSEIRKLETLLFREFLDKGRVLTDEQLIKFHIKKGEFQYERKPAEKAYLESRTPQEFEKEGRKSSETDFKSREENFKSGICFDQNGRKHSIY
jgi:hypothetical protein